MMGKKDYESSDSDDSDFVIDLHHDSSDNSLQSERETITAETNDTYDNNNLKKRKKNIVNRNHLTKKKRYFSDKTQKGKLVTTKNLDNSQNQLSPNDDKARADSLWKHFLNDTATSSKAPLCISTNRTETSPDLNEVIDTKQTNYSHTVNFEKTTDTKACAINKIIKNEKIALIPPNKNIDKLATSSELHVQENCLKKQHFSSILHNIKKKSKLTTLEKSKLDWNQFKEEHNLEEEISHYNRGKSGYLERQDFLQRADSRQFEIEKELRNVGKRKTR